MKKVTSWIKNIFIFVIVLVISLEFLSFLATKLNLFLINETPHLYSPAAQKDFPDITYGRTERDKWGAWHVSNATFRHSKKCFSVKMTFNEVGARDDTFIETSPSALVLLGDSFAEGFGVERNEMSEYLMEKELNLSILNFGASGNFGPLQELMIYDEFNDLPHQGLIIYVLPANDFTDNDAEYWQEKYPLYVNRYRPYFNPKGNPLVPFYFSTAIPRNNFVIEPKSLTWKQFIVNNFWSSNAMRSTLILIRGEVENSSNINEITKSFYYDATKIQQSNLVLAYEAIMDIAENKNILFVIIPSKKDIERFKQELFPLNYQNTFWYKSFIGFQDGRKQRVEILDLMEYLPELYQDLFFDCDDHWSPEGNKWAADTISQYIKDKKLFKIQK